MRKEKETGLEATDKFVNTRYKKGKEKKKEYNIMRRWEQQACLYLNGRSLKMISKKCKR